MCQAAPFTQNLDAHCESAPEERTQPTIIAVVNRRNTA